MEKTIIKIKDVMETSRVRVFVFPDDISMDKQENCPSCIKSLEVICLFTSDKDQKIRYGLCGTCGYMGYMDRPMKEWMINFYSKSWDKPYSRTLEDVKKSINLTKGGAKAGRYLSVSLLDKIGADKDKWVCEIGTGYGEVLKNLEMSGYKKLIGLENSGHRAKFVKDNFGYNVLHGEFESDHVQKELSKLKPIGTFFSHHVLEHVYSPVEIIKLASDLQDQGDHLVLSLPNGAGEHINLALFYFVHLHSFTKESLEILLNKHGYEFVADSSPDDSNIIIAARKVISPKPKLQLKNDYKERILTRINKAFGLEHITKDLNYEICWEEKIGELDPIYKTSGINLLRWRAEKLVAFIKSHYLHRFSSKYRILVGSAEKITASKNEIPVSIRFDSNIKFLIK